MNPRLHLLIPMSGQGRRYQAAGFTDPKPLIPINGRAMIARLLESFPMDWPTHFVLAENHEATRLPSLLKELRPQGRLQFVPQHTLGPGHAIRAALEHIPVDTPVLVSYCDYGMVFDARQFERFVRATECDACLISYRGFHAHYLSPTPYAYSRMEGDRVLQVKEKGSFTENRENEFASAGTYYFRTAALLREAIDAQEKYELHHQGEYYTSLTVEALLRLHPNADVRVFEIPGFFQWGTPEDLKIFEYWEKSIQAWGKKRSPQEEKTAQILMTMAGSGERFRATFDIPKPFLPINGVPMAHQALEALPKAEKTVGVTLAPYQTWFTEESSLFNEMIFLSETPPGQAYTTQEGMKALSLDQEVLVTPCDHAVRWEDGLWNQFKEEEVDAAIFAIKGFPGTDSSPRSFSYVEVEGEGRFPSVKKVSVKVPLSAKPSQDFLLVGTFWFRTGQILQEGLTELIEKKIQTNGEVYLDTVFNVLIDRGYRVKAFPLTAYVGWGDPESLSAALYWQEIFLGHRLDARPRFPGIPAKKTS